MAVSQITESQHALFNNLIKKDLTTSNQNNTSNLLSNLGTSTDLSPILSMALCNNYSSNIFSSFANMFSNYFMQMLMMLFLQNIFNNTKSNTLSEGISDDTACSNVQSDASSIQEDCKTACEPASEQACETPVQCEKQEVKDIVSINKDNFNNEVRNQKGTQFIIVCGDSCGRCKTFEKNIDEINENLGGKASLATLTLPYSKKNKTKKDADSMFNELRKEAKSTKTSYGYPIIIKMVDGKAQSLYDYSDIKNIYSNEEKMSEWLSSKI